MLQSHMVNVYFGLYSIYGPRGHYSQRLPGPWPSGGHLESGLCGHRDVYRKGKHECSGSSLSLTNLTSINCQTVVRNYLIRPIKRPCPYECPQDLE